MPVELNSLLGTGRLPYHVQQINRQNCNLGQGAHRNFTFLSSKMKQAGYSTHHVGKWHLGMASWGQIPAGRGFDTSLVYFEGAERLRTTTLSSAATTPCASYRSTIPRTASVPVSSPTAVESLLLERESLRPEGRNGYG